GDGAGDRGMLLGGGGEPYGGVAGEPAQAPQVQAQSAQRFGEVAVAARGIECRIELSRQRVVGGGVLALGELGGGLFEARGELSEVFARRIAVDRLCDVLGGAACGERLQGDAQVEQLWGLVEGD